MNDIVVDPVEPMMPRTMARWSTFILIRNVTKSRKVVRRMCLIGVSALAERC